MGRSLINVQSALRYSANNCWQTKKVLWMSAGEAQGEVYIHTYSFSGETEVASDLGFE